MTIIAINRLTKTFVTGITRKKKTAVADVSFSVDNGEIFGIIGVNGAGKSSVLKMILGFIKPDSGTIFITGIPPRDPRSRQSIGYLPENPYFYDHLTAEEMLLFSATASGMDRKTALARSDHLLERVHLSPVKSQKLRSYSKGMTQRAGLCFALVHDPQIVILDEPMSGLDPIGRKMVIDLIKDLKGQGKTVLFCSHILSDVERICDRVAIMDKGHLKRLLTRDQIIQQRRTCEIWVDRLPEMLESRIKQKGFSLKNRENAVIVECHQEDMGYVLSEMGDEHIHIIHVDTSVNPIEKIFLETVDGES